MADLLVLTVGEMPAYMPCAMAEWQGAGLRVSVLLVAGKHLPMFDGRALQQLQQLLHPGAARLGEELANARGLVLVGPAAAGSCPGALINALQLIGGPAYDHSDAPPPLTNLRVSAVIMGSPEDARAALPQIATMVRAMGGTLAATVWANGPGVMPPDVFARRVLAPGQDNLVSAVLSPVDMSLGGVHFPAPDAARAAAAAAATAISIYGPSGGLPELRAALAHYLRTGNLPANQPERVVVTAGATAGICACLLAHLRPGDGVLLPGPGFPNYRQMAIALGLRPFTHMLLPENGYLPDLAELGRLAPAARAIIIIWNFPHNPLGSVAPPELVSQVIDLARAHDLLVISDEVYAGFT